MSGLLIGPVLADLMRTSPELRASMKRLLAVYADAADFARRLRLVDVHRMRKYGLVHYARHHRHLPHPPIKPNRTRSHRRRAS